MRLAHELISSEKQPALTSQPVRGGKVPHKFSLVFH